MVKKRNRWNRVYLSITDEEMDYLNQLCGQFGLTRAQILRRGMEIFFAKYEDRLRPRENNNDSYGTERFTT